MEKERQSGRILGFFGGEFGIEMVERSLSNGWVGWKSWERMWRMIGKRWKLE